MSPLALTIAGSIAAPLLVGAVFRATTTTVPADKRATYNAIAHGAAAAAAYLASHRLHGTKAHLARGALYGEGVAAAFALAGPQLLNATGAAKFAGMSPRAMYQLRRYYGLD